MFDIIDARCNHEVHTVALVCRLIFDTLATKMGQAVYVTLVVGSKGV